jgi:TrmH family RNA methyltransferase
MLSKNQIKEIQSLQLKKFRGLKRLFIAEGIKTVTEIMEQSPALIQELFATAEFIADQASLLNRLSVRYTPVTEEELKKISLQSNPNAVLAVCHYFEETEPVFDPEKDFSFYLDDIRDPGNLGTIIRLADWFGMNTVFCSPDSCDVYNPKVIQSTMGAFLRVKVVYRELKDLADAGHVRTVYGAVLDGKDLYRQKLESGLIVIGNEANGIRASTMEHLTQRLTIPANRNNGTESLNAAMAASILAAEFFRQLRHT